MGLWCTQMSAGAWVVMIGAWALVIGLAVWAVCRLFPAQRADARAILDARLASGQIDQDTYQQVRDRLDGHAPTPTKGLS